jgi:signal peptide peptidase SppA
MTENPSERFPHLMQRLFNTPLCIRQEKAEMIVAALAQRFGIARLDVVDAHGVRHLSSGDFAAQVSLGLSAPPADTARYYELVQGVAVIQVEGTLVAKLGTLHPWSGMTGYDGIRANLATALDDGAARAVVLDIDSGGGEGAGLFDLVDAIHAARQGNGGTKPIWAILTEDACSAAYAIASACDRIVMPRTGNAGSIGVWTMHVDWSEAMKDGGIAVTLIFAGKHKVDGHPFAPLPPAVHQDIQAGVDWLRQLFITTVARNRGLSTDAVAATEGRVYRGEEALSLGLVDAVMAPDDALAELIAQLSIPA